MITFLGRAIHFIRVSSMWWDRYMGNTMLRARAKADQIYEKTTEKREKKEPPL